MWGRKTKSRTPNAASPTTSGPSHSLMAIMRLAREGREALEAGRGDEALTILSQKHELVREMFPVESGSYAASLVDLADAYALVGRMREARGAVQEAIATYQRLEAADEQLDHVETSLIGICARQGHFFEVERIAKLRIERLRTGGADADLQRAVTQDELGKVFLDQQRYDEAIAMFTEALPVFEQQGDGSGEDVGVCCLYLARAYGRLEQYEHAVTFGRRAVACAEQVYGVDSEGAAVVSDELAVLLGLYAVELGDAAMAQESLERSARALTIFEALHGRRHQTSLRSRENHEQLEQMLHALATDGPSGASGEEASDDADAIALPTNCFISHRYADRKAMCRLREVLPSYVVPVIFEPIDVSPTEFVSEKLISGVMGSEGVIFIDSDTSNGSFWTAFERDLANRHGKPLFRFSPEDASVTRVRQEVPKLWLAHLYHPADEADVTVIARWLADERFFELFDDPVQLGENSAKPFATMSEEERGRLLRSGRSYGACYALFLSETTLEDPALAAHVEEQVTQHGASTVVCWLDPERARRRKAPRAIRKLPKEHVFEFSARPSVAAFNRHELDDLMVRLYWVFWQRGLLGAAAN